MIAWLNNLGLILRLAYVVPSHWDCVVRQIRQVGTSHLAEDNAIEANEGLLELNRGIQE